VLEATRSKIDINEIVGSNTYDFEKVSQSAAWVKAINGDHDHDQYVQQYIAFARPLLRSYSAVAITTDEVTVHPRSLPHYSLAIPLPLIPSLSFPFPLSLSLFRASILLADPSLRSSASAHSCTGPVDRSTQRGS
jgi:hypothetical protein